MADPCPIQTEHNLGRFAFGLTTEAVERFRTILREDCGEEVTLEEAWSRAAGLLALTQLLLDNDG